MGHGVSEGPAAGADAVLGIEVLVESPLGRGPLSELATPPAALSLALERVEPASAPQGIEVPVAGVAATPWRCRYLHRDVRGVHPLQDGAVLALLASLSTRGVRWTEVRKLRRSVSL